MLELELHDVAFATAERQRARSGIDSGQPDDASRRSELARAFLGRWKGVLDHADAVHVELSDLMDDVMYYSERFRLTASDSIHAAMVVASGADGLVTNEPAFGAVDASLLPIFTPQGLTRPTARARPRRFPR